MLEVFIVNCLFLYRSKVRVQMTYTSYTSVDVHVISPEAELIELSVGSGAVRESLWRAVCSTVAVV